MKGFIQFNGYESDNTKNNGKDARFLQGNDCA